MRTTLELPDDLLIAVKKRALEIRQPFKKLVESALRREIGLSLIGEDKGKPKPIRWITSSANPPDFDVADREAMFNWLQRQP